MNKRGMGYSHNCESTQKNNPDCVKINSEEFDGDSDGEIGDIDEELDDG